jgi:nucleoside-diphosphate-sugar epimerase
MTQLKANEMNESLPSRELHVVLGAGQIGPRVAERLLAKGHRVRLVRQQAQTSSRRGLEIVSGDMSDPAFAVRATQGASVVYDCMNPAYHRWAEQLLPLARGALLGATKASARLVALDCLYMYGRPQGAMSETTPMNPCSKKGELRVKLAEMRMGAHQRGEARVTIGRASDFFGSNLPYSAWSDRFYQRALRGAAVECMGDPDMPHAYTYVEDIARALVTLGERDEASGQVWHLPTNAAESTQALATRLGDALGMSIRVKRVPLWLMKIVGVFEPFLREVQEMVYQWEVPFMVDDSKFRAAFGYGATPTHTAVQATAGWAREHYGIKTLAPTDA